MSRLFFTTILFFALCVPSLAQNPVPTPPPTPTNGPVAKLEGPSVLKVGFTARYTTEGSLGKTFKWMVYPPDAEKSLTIYALASEKPEQPQKYLALFESDKPGLYLLTFVATVGDQSAITQLSLLNGDGGITIL